MRFKQFLLEENFYSFSEVAHLLKKNCSKFLKESDGLPLYRGYSLRLKLDPKSVMYVPQPENRPPKDSSEEFNLMFNCGAKFLTDENEIRKNSLFVTGSRMQASEYGNIYYIFPINDYSFIYSNEIYDSYEKSSDILNVIKDYLEKDYKKLSFNQYLLNSIFKELAENGITPEILIKNKSPIIDQCIKNSILSHYDRIGEINFDDYFNALKKSLLKAIKSTFLELYKNNSSIKEAILSRCEIIFYKSDGFYVISEAAIANNLDEKGIQYENSSSRKYIAFLENLDSF